MTLQLSIQVMFSQTCSQGQRSGQGLGVRGQASGVRHHGSGIGDQGHVVSIQSHFVQFSATKPRKWFGQKWSNNDAASLVRFSPVRSSPV